MAIFRSLRLRFILALIVVALVPVGTVAFMINRATDEAFRDYSAELDRVNAESVAAQVGAVTGQPVSVVNTGGAIIADAPVQTAWTISPGTSAPANVALPAGSEGLPQTAAITEAGGGSVTQSGEAGGSVGFGGASTGPPAGVASADGSEEFTLSWPGLPDQSFLSDVNRALLVALGVAAVGALGLALLLARSIVRPVERLTAAARGIADGDLDQRVSAGSADEIGQLADAFNVMAESRQRLDGLRRNLVNDVAHELRSPLANLQGYLEVLRDGLTAPTPEILAVLHEESLQLNGLVADLQELALAEAGQLPLTREPVELRDPILKAIDAMRPQAESQRVTLDARLPTTLPEVLVDASRFTQILRNLLRNAVTHTPPGGRIDVSAAAGERHVTVEVCDTGHGIEPEHLPHIFDRFYRADPARSRDTGGSGLGLAVVKNLVEAHGGTISVSSAIDRGTTFTFTLPIAATVIEAAPG